MRVRFKVFRSTFDSWNKLFKEAAAFASEIPREDLISVCHSADHSEGVVTVWYWGDDTYDPDES